MTTAWAIADRQKHNSENVGMLKWDMEASEHEMTSQKEMP
jgi:hypothetical protein